MIAADDGPLVAELKAFGGEWVPLRNATVNPFRLRKNARILEDLIAHERIDIVHAQSIGGAWSAQMAAAQIAVWLVTTLPDVPPASGLRAFWASALARGDRVIAPSNYAAGPIMARYEIARDRITVIPRGIDTGTFDPKAVAPERVEKLLKAWRIRPDERVVLAPGRVAPWNGQILLPDVARALLDSGARNFVFVVLGENRRHRKYARAVLRAGAGARHSRGVPHDRALCGPAGRLLDRRGGGCAGDRSTGSRPRGGASPSDGPARGHRRHRNPAGTCGDAAGDAGGRAHRLGGQAGRSRSSLPGRSALPSRSISAPIRRWRRARGNSPNTCFRRRAWRWQPARSIRHSWHATPEQNNAG